MSQRRSHPPRVRGLKLIHLIITKPVKKSHPPRVRGLKLRGLPAVGA